MVQTQEVADDHEQFVHQTERFRRQLLAHCYRLMRSIDDAEDAVQETYLRAWRAYGNFEGRSSVRTWLFRIATNACLTALQHHGRRVLPTGLGGQERDADGPDGVADSHLTWPHSVPDAAPRGEFNDPAEIVAMRDNTRLALIASLRHLPARQRVVLILRDVLEWPTAEVAELLETTTDAVKSTLKRARARIEQRALVAEDVAEPAEPAHRALLDEYVTAFQNSDTAAFRNVLRHDATVVEVPSMAVA